MGSVKYPGIYHYEKDGDEVITCLHKNGHEYKFTPDWGKAGATSIKEMVRLEELRVNAELDHYAKEAAAAQGAGCNDDAVRLLAIAGKHHNDLRAIWNSTSYGVH